MNERVGHFFTLREFDDAAGKRDHLCGQFLFAEPFVGPGNDVNEPHIRCELNDFPLAGACGAGENVNLVAQCAEF